MVHPKQAAVISSSDEVVVNIDGSCPGHEPYVRALKSVSDSATTIVGVATATGRQVVASPDAFATKTQVVFAEVTVTVERQLLGPKLPRQIKVYLQGGSVGRLRTTVSSILEGAWAVDGRFFGTVSPGTAVVGSYDMNVLPLAGNLISFAAVGCRKPLGVPLSSDKSGSTALVMDDGEIIRRSGRHPKVDLTSVEKSLR